MGRGKHNKKNAMKVLIELCRIEITQTGRVNTYAIFVLIELCRIEMCHGTSPRSTEVSFNRAL